MSVRNQAVAGVKWNSFEMALRVIVQFITLAILARLLSPADFGLLAMVTVITGFATAFANFGLSSAIIYRQDATREQLSSLYWLSIAAGWIVFIAILIATPFIERYYNEPDLAPILFGVSVTFLIIPLGQQFQDILRRKLRFNTLALVNIAQNMAYAVVAITLAFADFGVMSLVWATIARASTGAVLLLIVAARNHWLPSLHFRRSDLDGFVQFGLFQMGERAINYLSANVDYLIIGRFLGAEQLGFYTLAFNLMRVPLSYINPIIVNVAFPAFARFQHQNDVLRRGYIKVLQFLSVIIFPLMAGMFVVAPLFIPVVYGDNWMPAVPIVQIFCLLGVVKSLGNPIGSLLLAKGRPDLGFYMNIIAVIGLAGSNLLGVRWGITGVAFSTLIFTLFVLLPIDFYLRWRVINMNLLQFWAAVREPAIAAVVLVIVTEALHTLTNGKLPNVVELILLTVTGALAYLISIWLIDRQLIIEVWGYLRPKPIGANS